MEEETVLPITEAIWAQVEIMGHRIRVGQLREVVKFGKTMIEIYRPALAKIEPYEEETTGYSEPRGYGSYTLVNGIRRYEETPAVPAQTEWYSPDSLFCVKEITENEAMALLQKGRPSPNAEFIPDPAALLESTDDDDGLQLFEDPEDED
jgi:hypothetical protein